MGTGSGYQAVILAKFTPDIYTIEIVEPLHTQAAALLQKFGLGPDRVLQGDGYFGVEKAAPFDGIIVTAAADHIPPPLIQQLRPGGRMVIPIGPVHATQRLVMVTKGCGRESAFARDPSGAFCAADGRPPRRRGEEVSYGRRARGVTTKSN